MYRVIMAGCRRSVYWKRGVIALGSGSDYGCRPIIHIFFECILRRPPVVGGAPGKSDHR